jgi:hypothetical protein
MFAEIADDETAEMAPEGALEPNETPQALSKKETSDSEEKPQDARPS